MTYVDSSVLLADLFAEPRTPPTSLWDEDLASSGLLAYEVSNWVNAGGRIISHGDRARGLLARVNLTEMSERVLARALYPFPVAIRTLDALHLGTMDFIRAGGEVVELARYDNRLIAAARAFDISLGCSLKPISSVNAVSTDRNGLAQRADSAT